MANKSKINFNFRCDYRFQDVMVDEDVVLMEHVNQHTGVITNVIVIMDIKVQHAASNL